MFGVKQTPVEVISYCGLDGRIQPLRFRYKDADDILQTANVLEVVDVHTVEHVGAESFRYLCKTEVQGMHHMMELVYAFRAHTWSLARKLY